MPHKKRQTCKGRLKATVGLAPQLTPLQAMRYTARVLRKG